MLTDQTLYLDQLVGHGLHRSAVSNGWTHQVGAIAYWYGLAELPHIRQTA